MFITAVCLLFLLNMLKLFQKTSNIHSYNTRSSTSGKFFVKSSRLEIQNNSFSRLGVKLWNKIPRYITDLPKRTFKRVLRKLLFDTLENMNPHDYPKSRYIDTLVIYLILQSARLVLIWGLNCFFKVHIWVACVFVLSCIYLILQSARLVLILRFKLFL